MSKLYPTHCVMWMPIGWPWCASSQPDSICCARMAMALQHECVQHDDPWDCPDTTLVYHEIFDEYGIPIRDGGRSVLLIDNCPWCGTRLPETRRDGWFDLVEAAGLDPQNIEALPKRFLSAEWRKDGNGGRDV